MKKQRIRILTILMLPSKWCSELVMTPLRMGLPQLSSRRSPNIVLVLATCLNIILSLAFKSHPVDPELVFWCTWDQTKVKPCKERRNMRTFWSHFCSHPYWLSSELCFHSVTSYIFSALLLSFLALKLYFTGKCWFDELFCLFVLP